MRTDLTTDLDAALSGRDTGSRGYWECARSGNGNMKTDLLSEDGQDYEELEGLGESVEEMDAAESAAEDRGNQSIFKPYREPLPSEHPPYAPKPGKAWLRRRIRMQSRRPGGNRLARVRWAQVSPSKYADLNRKGLIKSGAVDGLGFMDISSDLIKGVTIGAVMVIGYQVLKRRGILNVGGKA